VRYAEAIATSAIETSDFLRGDLFSAQIGAAQQGRTKKLSFNKRPIRFYLHGVNAPRATVVPEEGAGKAAPLRARGRAAAWNRASPL
jgi:hypothetical protein